MAYSPEQARELALSALIWMTEDPDLIQGFLGATGLRPEDLRAMASDADLAVHVLDFVLQADERVLRVAQVLQIKPEEVMTARTILAGPGSHGWSID
jgi:hypothetical protein